MLKNILPYLDDLLVFAGFFCIVFGLSKWSIPLAWIVGGLQMVVIGYYYGKHTNVS